MKILTLKPSYCRRSHELRRRQSNPPFSSAETDSRLSFFHPDPCGSLVPPATGIANDTPTRHLLLLNSYHQSLKWDEEIYAAIKAVLRPAENNIELHVENMDTKRVPYTDAYRSQLLALLKNAYGKMRFDLIIASDNNAYDFLRTYRDELFPGVPVVFCGVNNFEPEQLQGIPAFTGVAEIFDARALAHDATAPRDPRTAGSESGIAGCLLS
ncbi:MAG: hypothetical protein KZQ97_19345 [Candidatus Thiodiazotropha sp. (ex Dulcina madagascariensis)]|nr:hypothetical protein [Candidatus Thiodiazotropha sp. (ex Dulcina madagascariensis)]